MENKPQMMTIREVARTGLLPEHALRVLARQQKLPCIYVGAKCYINYTALVAMLENLHGDEPICVIG